MINDKIVNDTFSDLGFNSKQVKFARRKFWWANTIFDIYRPQRHEKLVVKLDQITMKLKIYPYNTHTHVYENSES